MREYAEGYRAKKNELRRLKYQNDAAHREKCKKLAKEYREKNPKKRRDAAMQKMYGVSPADYARLMKKQNNACAICRFGFSSTPHIDHCHATNTPRGLLCSQCNLGLGKFRDSPDCLRRAAEYLEAHKTG